MYTGESRLFQQQISGDTITSATWTATPSTGVTLSGQVDTPTSSTILFHPTVGAAYSLEVALSLQSGQLLYGIIQVSVVNKP